MMKKNTSPSPGLVLDLADIPKGETQKPTMLAVQKGSGNGRLLTREEFQHFSEVPPETEWFANIKNLHTRRAYKNDVQRFMSFLGIERPDEFRTVTRAHIIAWRKDLEASELAAATIRRKLSALSDLFDHLCEANAITHNPVKGVERPTEGANEGKTPAISDGQARSLIAAPATTTLKGKRDRAILSVLLYHALRRAELCALCVKDYEDRRGIRHLRVLESAERSVTFRLIRRPLHLSKIIWTRPATETTRTGLYSDQ